MSVNVRPIQASDFFLVTGLIKKLRGPAGKEIRGAIKSTNEEYNLKPSKRLSKAEAKELDEQREQAITMQVLAILYEHMEQEIVKWFASLCECSVDEFMKLPATAPLDIIETLSTREDVKGFFSHALRVLKTILPSVIGSMGGLTE